MKDTFDVMADVISLLNQPEFTALVDGAIWANARPNNSAKTDVVVGCSAPSNDHTQVSYGFVNIYVPEKEIPNGAGQLVPHYEKMRELCKAALPLLDTQFRYSFQLEVETSGEIEQDADNSWFVHIGFKYTSIQTNYQNI